MSGVAPGAYDPVELRRRIAVCFSVGELRALADSLGVGAVPWERGIDEAAREVVKQSGRYAGLPALVARLREARPLVEWPEPAPVPAEAARSHVLAAPPAIPTTLASEAGPPALSASPGTLASAAPPAPAAALAPFLDPYAPPPGPPAVHLPPPPPTASYAPSTSAPPSRWPGTAEVAPPPARTGIDPRILVAVAGITLVAAIVAYLAGRASSSGTAAAPSATASPGREGGPRPDGPAGRAVDAIARSFANMARVCELPASAGANELVFRRVFERCGPAPLSRRANAVPVPAAPTAQGDQGDTPNPDRGAARGPRGRDAPAPAPAARGCMGSCDATHAACRGRCGPEPTESSAYDAYNRCLGRCLSDASRCRLGCH